MIFQLVTVTPYRLQYLCTAQTTEESEPDQGVIPNQLGLTPDLRTDTQTWLGYPINKLVSTPVATSLAATTLLQGLGLNTVPSLEIPRAHCYIHQRISSGFVAAVDWTVRALEGAAAGFPLSAGFAVLLITGPGLVGVNQAYLTVDFEHTYDR